MRCPASVVKLLFSPRDPAGLLAFLHRDSSSFAPWTLLALCAIVCSAACAGARPTPAAAANDEHSDEHSAVTRYPQLPASEQDAPRLGGQLQQGTTMAAATGAAQASARAHGLVRIASTCERSEGWCVDSYRHDLSYAPAQFHHVAIVPDELAEPFAHNLRQVLLDELRATSTSRTVAFAHALVAGDPPQALRPLTGEDRWSRLETWLQVELADSSLSRGQSPAVAELMRVRAVLEAFELSVDTASLDAVLEAAAGSLEPARHPLLVSTLSVLIARELQRACPTLERVSGADRPELERALVGPNDLLFRPHEYVLARIGGVSLPPLPALIDTAGTCQHASSAEKAGFITPIAG